MIVAVATCIVYRYLQLFYFSSLNFVNIFTFNWQNPLKFDKIKLIIVHGNIFAFLYDRTEGKRVLSLGYC